MLAVRRELVNFKKVLLHCFNSAVEQEKDLRQLASFFFADHLEQAELDAVPAADASATVEAAFVHSKRYDAICEALAECCGVRVALHNGCTLRVTQLTLRVAQPRLV